MTPLRCHSPIDGSLVAERDPLSAAAAGGRVHAARAAQSQWARTLLDDRIRIVGHAIDLLCADPGGAARELAEMMGRPLCFNGELGGVRERSDHMIGIAADALAAIEAGTKYTDGAERRILRVPQGVVLVIAPWNYPYLTAINTIVPALIAGNAVVLKHAAQTILAGERIEAAFAAAGLPADVFMNLHLDHAATGSLIADGCFDFINFTGSVEAGRTMERHASGTFTGLGLELGGKDPAYVMADADPARAAASLMDGAFFNAGQCCCGIERVYVDAPIHDAFVEAAKAEAEALVLGDPRHAATTLGPMARAHGAEAVRRQIAEATHQGARNVVDLSRFDADTGRDCYVAPCILTEVSHDMAFMREENFAPAVGVMKVSSDEEAVRLINDSDLGLTVSLWTGDAERADALAAQVETGTVYQNCCDYLDPALCWTGVKNTGRGGTLSALGYHNLTRPKSFYMRRQA